MNPNIKQCPNCNAYVYVINKEFCCGKKLIEEPLVVLPLPIKKKPKKLKEPKKKRKKKHYNMAPETKEAVLKRDKWKCTKCGSKNDLQIHHKTYRSNGGTDELENLVTLCGFCHAEEHKGEPVYNIMIQRLWLYESV